MGFLTGFSITIVSCDTETGFWVSSFGKTVLDIAVVSGGIKTNFSTPFSIMTVFGGSTVKFINRDQNRDGFFLMYSFAFLRWLL